MQAEDQAWFSVDHESTVGAARLEAKRTAERINFSVSRVEEVAIVASEIASNLYRHAKKGALLVRVLRDLDQAGIGLIALDEGPGIEDQRWAMTDGHSTVGTLGIGLGAIDRLSSWSDNASTPGFGTVIAVELWPHDPPGRPDVDGITRPMAGETVCGDGVGWREDDKRTTVLLVDGLGHGPLAARAARLALNAFMEHAGGSPAETVMVLHRALNGTRGAAVAVADVDRGARTVTFAGVGNISGWIVTGSQRRGMASTPGIAGHQVRRVRQFGYDLTGADRVVLHSDGIRERWEVSPILASRDLTLGAASLLRDGGLRHDDASVVVVEASWRS